AARQAVAEAKQAGWGAAPQQVVAVRRVPAAPVARGAHPAHTCDPEDVGALHLPRVGHVAGPVVRAVGGLWLTAWIVLFVLGAPVVALIVMVAWIAADSAYESGVRRRKKARKAHRRAQRAALAQAAAAPPPPDPAVAARQVLVATVRRVEVAAMPPGAVAAVREVADVVGPLLERTAGPGADARVAHDLQALAGEYLPTAVEDYLRLPPDVATTRRGPGGLTAAEELAEQLALLLEGARQLREAVLAADAERLTTQRRFLEAKFRRSDLDL
ncbi:hypothetical protein, partial [Kineococcus glutinatus]|uniref:hypothetical protein n=1 Tax=Kineococcus glutinatus TaxID=1070872 RepID=UPI0031EE6F2E